MAVTPKTIPIKSQELKCDLTSNSLGPLTWLLCCFQPYYSLYKQFFFFFTVIQPNSSVRQSEVLGQVSKLCRWRPCDTTEITSLQPSNSFLMRRGAAETFSAAKHSNFSSQRQMCKRTLLPLGTDISLRRRTTRALSTHTDTKQRKRPHSEYKSWQFGNWAFGLMGPPGQHPEPADRQRDLNKRAEYWGEQRCRGDITVKM